MDSLTIIAVASIVSAGLTIGVGCVAPALSVAVPSESAPSRKVTDPVAPAGVTSAVSVTPLPMYDGLGLEPSVMSEGSNWRSSTETVLEPKFATARSGRPSAFRSPMATENGP